MEDYNSIKLRRYLLLEKNVQLKGISIISNGSTYITKEVGSRNEGRINVKESFPD